jgi:adenylosuccinate lyase
MIDRYTRREMAEVWSEKEKFSRWLEVELSVTEHWANHQLMTPLEWKNFKKKSELILKKGIDVQAIAKLDLKLKHDVLAFTTYVSSQLGQEGRYLHYGLTSTDVVDTALSLTLQRAGQILLSSVKKLKTATKKKAIRYKKLATIGRTHGMFAEPTTFGLKFLGFYQEITRSENRLKLALENIRVGKLSGAVGANTHLSVQSEIVILKKLGLKREEVSTQVLPRDRFADLICAISILGSSLERFAIELRHLQRSEVSEVREEFSKSQKGSSAMPHKRNPVSSENITGCARLLRSYCIPALENIALWHERDISHSAAERVILPDAFILADYAVDRFTNVMDGLVVDSVRVRKNLDQASQVVLAGHLLLELVTRGLSREVAYRCVQKASHQAIDQNKSLLDVLDETGVIKKWMNRSEIEKVLSFEHALRGVDGIYQAIL